MVQSVPMFILPGTGSAATITKDPGSSQVKYTKAMIQGVSSSQIYYLYLGYD